MAFSALHEEKVRTIAAAAWTFTLVKKLWRGDLHVASCSPTYLRFTGANRDAKKYRTRDEKTQRFAPGATAS